MKSEGLERSVNSPELIYVVLKTFPERDSNGNQGRHYRVVLPDDLDYDVLNERLKEKKDDR